MTDGIKLTSKTGKTHPENYGPAEAKRYLPAFGRL
jgi:hypothetical protein